MCYSAGMSYRECLYTFVTVYRHGSQQKAADELHLTQPAVSQHLKILENHIGKALFQKKGRTLVPTLAAHQLVLEIGDAFSQLDQALHHIKGDTTLPRGVVCLGGIAEFFAKVLVPLLKPLLQYDVQLRFEPDHQTLLPRLLSGEFDLAHFTTHVVHPQIVIEKLYHQEFILVGHPAFKKQRSAEGLQKLPWIAYDESLLFISEYFQHVFNQPFAGSVKLLIKDLWGILEAVSAGIGVTVMPAQYCKDLLNAKKIQVLFTPQKALTHQSYLGWKQGALNDPKIKLVKELLLGKDL
jgi:DNA-binding transcriptional LysR family regulator